MVGWCFGVGLGLSVGVCQAGFVGWVWGSCGVGWDKSCQPPYHLGLGAGVCMTEVVGGGSYI